MNRSTLVYAVLLAAALLGAYLSWTDEPETTVSDGVVVADFEAGGLERIEYTAPNKELTVTAKSEDGDRYWWVDSTRQVEVSPSADDRSAPDAGRTAGPDAGSPDAGGPDASTTSKPETKTVQEVYKASSIFDRFLEDISPLRARRKLPEPDAERRKTYGFDGETKKLVFITESGSHTFTVGSYTYGRQHVYVRDEATGNYYVVATGVIGPFEFSETRLKNTRIMAESEKHLASVAVQQDGRSVELVRHNRDDPTAAFWSFGSGKKERNKAAHSWIAKLLRTQIARYVEGEPPAELQPRVVVRLESTDGKTTEIEFFKREAGDATKYFARSEYAKGFVALKRSAASSLLSDIPTLFEAAGK